MVKKLQYAILSCLIIYCLVISYKIIAGIHQSNNIERTWVLVWEDQFDHVDVGPWWLYNTTSAAFAAYCVPGNVVSQDGKLRLYFKKEQVHEKNYSSAEYLLGSWDTTPYGRFVLNMRAAPGKALTTAFRLSYSESGVWGGDSISFWGNNPHQIDINHMWGVNDNEKEEQNIPITFSADKEFHEYGIEWGPDYIKWSIDGKPIWTSNHVLWSGKKISATLSTSAFDPKNSWAPKIDDSALPTYAECDYLRYYMKLKK
jgi:hypothetical protein